MYKVHFSILRLVAFAAIAFAPSWAAADTLIFDFLPANTFSGTAPAGTLEAVFTDVGTNQVQLAITSSLAAGENLDPGKALYLNFQNHTGNPGNLNFALTGNSGFSQAASVQTGNGDFKADGTGGHLDILFTYSSSTKALTNGESQTYLITTSSGTLSTADFNYLSDGGSPSWLAAIHVQNTPSGGSGSGWVGGVPGNGPQITTPELSSGTLMSLLLFSSVGIYGFRRIRRPVGALVAG
jgi:hypothetical protein